MKVLNDQGQLLVLTGGGGGGAFIGGMSNLGNSAGTTGVVSSQMVIVGGNNITVSQSINGQSATLSIVGPAQFLGGLSNIGNTLGDTGVVTGRLVLAGGNNVTLSGSTNAGSMTITVSTPNMVSAAGVSNVGNSAGDTGTRQGTIVFQGGNNITLSQITGANIATVVVSGPNTFAQFSGGLSNLGNTSGDTALVTGRLVLAAINNITLSGSTNGGSMTISISGPAPGAAAVTFGMSNLGNTAGTTGTVNGQFIVVGGAGIIGSQSLNGQSVTLSMVNSWSTATSVSSIGSANAVGANNGRFALEAHIHAGVGAFAAGSNVGNTSGDTASQHGTWVIAGSDGITVRGSTGAGGVHTAHIIANTAGGGGGVSHQLFDPYPGEQLLAGNVGQGSLHIQPMIAGFHFQYDRMALRVNFTNSTNSTGSCTLSFWVGIYTRNVSTLSLASSSSTSQGFTFSGTVGNNSLQQGQRVVTLGWTNTVSEGDYWLGIVSRTTSGGTNATFQQMLVSQLNSNFSGVMGVASANSQQRVLGFGTYSATTSAMPGSIAFSQITGLGSLAHRPPAYFFISQTV